MSIEVTVILDSGCFLPSEKKEGLAPGRYYANIGYFQNPKGCADIRVLVDDDERVFDPCLELEENNDTIEVRLVHNGTVNREGVTAAKTFHDKLLHLKDLQKIDRQLLAKLEALTKEDVAAATKDFLIKRELDAMMVRRDLLVAHFKKLIAEQGEAKVLY